jgi:hypothetical protein
MVIEYGAVANFLGIVIRAVANLLGIGPGHRIRIIFCKNFVPSSRE